MPPTFSKLAAVGLTAAALSFAAPAPAAAQSLDALRAQGVLAEGLDGFVKLRDPDASVAARAVAANVNAKRQDLYAKRAAEQNVPASEVGKIFAPKIVEQAPSGTYVEQPGGGFAQK